MKKYINALTTCPLFYRLSPENILLLLATEGCYIRHYNKDALIASEGETCLALAIVLQGSVELQKVYTTGKTITLTHLEPGCIFGEAIVFSHQQKYPATVIATTKATILFIDSQQIIKFCTNHQQVLENFMCLLSDKLLLLNKKVRDLSFSTIREKVCSFLLDEYQRQQTLVIKLKLSKKTLAEHMGIQRPSLSRDLINLKKEGLIDFSKDTITIKDIAEIENIVTS